MPIASQVVLKVEGLSLRDARTELTRLDQVSLSRSTGGEIVGVAGVEGNGQSELERDPRRYDLAPTVRAFCCQWHRVATWPAHRQSGVTEGGRRRRSGGPPSRWRA